MSKSTPWGIIEKIVHLCSVSVSESEISSPPDDGEYALFVDNFKSAMSLQLFANDELISLNSESKTLNLAENPPRFSVKTMVVIIREMRMTEISAMNPFSFLDEHVIESI